MPSTSMMVFSGNAHPELSTEIGSRLSLPLLTAIVGPFSDGEVIPSCREMG